MPAHWLQHLGQSPHQDQPEHNSSHTGHISLGQSDKIHRINPQQSRKAQVKPTLSLQPLLKTICTSCTGTLRVTIDTSHAGLQQLCATMLAAFLTSTRVAQSAQIPRWAAGGAISVPNDHSATPAISTLAPPILNSKAGRHASNTFEQGIITMHS